jgi:hypothetical protein
MAGNGQMPDGRIVPVSLTPTAASDALELFARLDPTARQAVTLSACPRPNPLHHRAVKSERLVALSCLVIGLRQGLQGLPHLLCKTHFPAYPLGLPMPVQGSHFVEAMSPS